MYGRKTMRNSTLAKGGLHIVYKANVSPGYQTRVRHGEDKMRHLNFGCVQGVNRSKSVLVQVSVKVRTFDFEGVSPFTSSLISVARFRRYLCTESTQASQNFSIEVILDAKSDGNEIFRKFENFTIIRNKVRVQPFFIVNIMSKGTSDKKQIQIRPTRFF